MAIYPVATIRTAFMELWERNNSAALFPLIHPARANSFPVTRPGGARDSEVHASLTRNTIIRTNDAQVNLRARSSGREPGAYMTFT